MTYWLCKEIINNWIKLNPLNIKQKLCTNINWHIVEIEVEIDNMIQLRLPYCSWKNVTEEKVLSLENAIISH